MPNTCDYAGNRYDEVAVLTYEPLSRHYGAKFVAIRQRSSLTNPYPAILAQSLARFADTLRGMSSIPPRWQRRSPVLRFSGRHQFGAPGNPNGPTGAVPNLVTFNPIAPKTMPNNTTISGDGYDEVSDTYAPPTTEQRLIYVERQVNDLHRKLLAHSYPYQRATGGAIDIDKPGAHARRWGK